MCKTVSHNDLYIYLLTNIEDLAK